MPLSLTRERFIALARQAHESLAARRAGAHAAAPAPTPVVPLGLRLLGDQLTPVLAYRRLVVRDDRTAPSFLFESVENGERIGRYSILGAAPTLEVVAHAERLTIRDRRAESAHRVTHETCPDPLARLAQLTAHLALVDLPADVAARLPGSSAGGWVGYAAYDAARYTEPGKIPFSAAPRDDRGLPDLHFAFYPRVVIFDHVQTLVHVVELVEVPVADEAGAAFDAAHSRLLALARDLQTHSKPLPSGALTAHDRPHPGLRSNMTRQQHEHIVARAKDYIRAGDIFQVVVGQRFELASPADPFDVYRALRAVNPSPYMAYLQAEGCILVASSPEILCRVRRDPSGALRVTNRPLAGTRRRGSSPDEDDALARELLADQKERAEHIMLVDLGRNDVGRVARAGSVSLPTLMAVERYSHVMHISSTVEGLLAPGATAWDALRAALPVGTISGAPKIRAMQIIDELEPVRRGPYGGGFGHAALSGEMDIALALRTIVVPTALRKGDHWTYHLQASGGIVHDSDPAAEFQETVNKAAALVRAVQVAEQAFCSTGDA